MSPQEEARKRYSKDKYKVSCELEEAYIPKETLNKILNRMSINKAHVFKKGLIACGVMDESGQLMLGL